MSTSASINSITLCVELAQLCDHLSVSSLNWHLIMLVVIIDDAIVHCTGSVTEHEWIVPILLVMHRVRSPLPVCAAAIIYIWRVDLCFLTHQLLCIGQFSDQAVGNRRGDGLFPDTFLDFLLAEGKEEDEGRSKVRHPSFTR